MASLRLACLTETILKAMYYFTLQIKLLLTQGTVCLAIIINTHITALYYTAIIFATHSYLEYNVQKDKYQYNETRSVSLADQFTTIFEQSLWKYIFFNQLKRNLISRLTERRF